MLKVNQPDAADRNRNHFCTIFRSPNCLLNSISPFQNPTCSCPILNQPPASFISVLGAISKIFPTMPSWCIRSSWFDLTQRTDHSNRNVLTSNNYFAYSIIARKRVNMYIGKNRQWWNCFRNATGNWMNNECFWWSNLFFTPSDNLSLPKFHLNYFSQWPKSKNFQIH